MSHTLSRVTLMPAFAGVCAWIARGTDSTVGEGIGALASWPDDFPVSDSLRGAIAAWQTEFEQADFDPETGYLLLDWVAYRRRGLELATQLKAELGDRVHVFYRKPIEDPNDEWERQVEVESSGRARDVPVVGGHSPKTPEWFPRRIVSGGQTGVDRAALDVACAYRIPHTGWCPKGRRAEDGPLSWKYQLQETESKRYAQRTRRNVEDSDATLVINLGDLEGGTLRTIEIARRLGRPCLILPVDTMSPDEARTLVQEWLDRLRPKTLNIAGPRESKRPGAYAASRTCLRDLFA